MNFNQLLDNARKEVYLNIGTIGHVDHGKSTLCCLISVVAEIFFPEWNEPARQVDDIDNAPEERARGITITVYHMRVGFERVQAVFNDCPGHQDFVNNMMNATVKCDFCVLVVAANDGMNAQSHYHAVLARDLGIKNVFVVLNKADLEDAEIRDIGMEEIRQSLNNYGLNVIGEIQISAKEGVRTGFEVLNEVKQKKARKEPYTEPRDYQKVKDDHNLQEVKRFLEFVESYRPEEKENSYQHDSFIMYVDKVYNPKGHGAILTGQIDGGTCTRGQMVEVVGMGREKIVGPIVNIQAFRMDVEKGIKGMDVGIQVKGVKKDNVMRGMAVMEKGKASLAQKVRVVFNCSDGSNEVGEMKKLVRNTSFGAGFAPQCQPGNMGVMITTKVLEVVDREYVSPGDIATLVLEFIKPLTVFNGYNILLKESDKLVGMGKVVEILA